MGDSKKVWKAVKALSGKVNLQPPKNLTVAQGEPIDSPSKLAEVWRQFLEEKFTATPAEQGRDPMSPLPPRDPANVISDKEFYNVIKTMKSNKATGPDKIPIEAFNASHEARELLK